jgi:tetratricopeptide (TPR) repeat protein
LTWRPAGPALKIRPAMGESSEVALPSGVTLSQPRSARGIWLMVIPLTLAVVAAFAPVLNNGFVDWDDKSNFVDNPHYRGLGLIQLGWAWTTFWLGVYQPLAWSLFGAEYLAWKLDPYGYHLTSLILHAVNTVVLYFLTMTVLIRCQTDVSARSPWPCALGSALATALYAVHPLRVEVVAWASCQPYLPCALFSMLAVLAYFRAVPIDAVARRRWQAVSLAMFVAAMLCHAVAVSLPVVLVILDVYPLRRFGERPGRWFGPAARRAWHEKIPFLMVSLAFIGLAIAARSRHVFSGERFRVSGRLAQACYGTWFYAFKTIVPRDLVAVYPLPREIDWRTWPFCLAILATIGATAGLFLVRRRWPAPLAAWLTYLVILAPNSGIVRTTDQIAADRYSYLASLGAVIAVAGGFCGILQDLRGRRSRAAINRAAASLVIAPPALTILVLIAISRDQCRTWRDTRTLWNHALSHSPGPNAVANYNLGHFLFERADVASAVAHYSEALRLDPSNVAIRNNLGVALSRQGRDAEAAAQHAAVLRLAPRSVDAHFNLAVLLSRQGRYEAAAAHYRDALRVDPDAADLHYNLGILLANLGRYDEAAAHYTEAIRINGRFAPAHNNLGVVLSRQGKFDQAAAHFAEALRLDPGYRDAQKNLDAARARQRNRAPR